MATVIVDAGDARTMCLTRIKELDDEFLKDKAEWLERAAKRPRRRGVWPFRYTYYASEAELEAHFNGSFYDRDSFSRYFNEESRLQQRSAHERKCLLGIIAAANVAESDLGSGKIELNEEEARCLNRLVVK